MWRVEDKCVHTWVETWKWGYLEMEIGVTTYLSRYYHLFCPRKKPLQVSDWIHFLLVPHLIAVDEWYFLWNEADVTDAVIFQSFFRQVKHVKLHLYLPFSVKPIKYLLYGVQDLKTRWKMLSFVKFCGSLIWFHHAISLVYHSWRV